MEAGKNDGQPRKGGEVPDPAPTVQSYQEVSVGVWEGRRLEDGQPRKGKRCQLFLLLLSRVARR